MIGINKRQILFKLIFKRRNSQISQQLKKEKDIKLIELIKGRYKDKDNESEDFMNSLISLPRYELIKNEEEINKEILLKWDKPINKKYDKIIIKYKKFHNIFQFFKQGLINIWKVNRNLKKGEGIFNGKRYLIDYSNYNEDNKDGKYLINRKDFNKIIDELSERIQLIKIEYENNKRNELINFKDKEIFINRKEFIEIIRDQKNFIKLPLFGIIFLIFEELSLPIIYLFPKILPNTCILPGFIERKYYKKREEGFNKILLIKNNEKNEEECREFIRDIAMNKINGNTIINSNQTIAKYICDIFDINNIQQHQKILLIDDYLILSNGGVSKLNDYEVVHCCMERGILVTGDVSCCDIPSAARAARVERLRQQLENWLMVRFL